MNDELTEKLEELFLDWEHRKARGELSTGHYHFLTAVPDPDEECGWAFYEREDTSETYTEAEYNHRPGAPVTLAIYQSMDYPGPCYSGCVWDEDPDGWETCKYAHLPDDWEDCISIRLNFMGTLLEAMDKDLIEARDLPDTEEEALAILKAAGFIPFDLGEFYEPVDVAEQVAEALGDLRAAAADAFELNENENEA